GEHAQAEDAYREASGRGCEPQPGLALLRLAGGDTAAAIAAIRRAIGETNDPMGRARLLPSGVEIMLAAGDIDGASAACAELERLAEDYASDMLRAAVAQARGSVALADGDAWEALVSLRNAVNIWHGLGAPYEVARARTLVGTACRMVGDEDTAAMELEAARETFAQLGAAADLARVDHEGAAPERNDDHGLSPRELEVLRLVAAGKTNKSVATELVISERTVDRHVSNIFAKLRVASRAAATAYAYENRLV
ncbi:MAG: LuxR C-terminal-related transcriptional regulator, partial [Gaiellaceae bacterium]